jgi:hypothetical protein
MISDGVIGIIVFQIDNDRGLPRPDDRQDISLTGILNCLKSPLLATYGII